MNARVLISVVGPLLTGSLLAGGWAYWNKEPSGDAWVVEQPELIVSSPAPGQKLHVDFVLRNTSSRPRRIFGVEAC